MVGLEFGHRLGLPAALSGLPLSPLVPRYQELVVHQRTLGLRHFGEVLIPHGGSLRVLDGVYVRRAARSWRRVDTEELRRLQADRAGAEVLLRRLAELHGRNPMALRQVLLYQLIEILQHHPQGGRTATAVSLGIDPGEAAALVHAARVRLRLDPRQRTAAEDLEDAWERGRLRRAARLAAELPTDGGQDPYLERRLACIAARVRETDAVLDSARQFEREGEAEAAGDRYLHAIRLAGDCPRAIRGLIHTSRPAGGSPSGLSVDLTAESVTLAWPVDTGHVSWRIIRLTRGTEQRPASLTEINGQTEDGAALDHQPPVGHEVRYAVFPLGDGVIAGPPLVSRALLVAPEVSGLRTADGRARVEATWAQPPKAVGVSVELTGPDGRTSEVDAPHCGFTAHGLRTGEHHLRVSCRYLTVDGSEVKSPGVRARVTVHPWPSPVLQLTAMAQAGCVRFSWTGGEGADVRLVEWPGDAPAPGTELPGPLSKLPASLPWKQASAGLVPPPGTIARVTAVAVLGERAVAGPGVRVEAPAPATALTVERIGEGLARVFFEWPKNVRQVTVVREQDDHCDEHRVTRTVFLREGLHIPVGPTEAHIRAIPTARTANATVVSPACAEAVLPADIAIAYCVRSSARRPLRRKPSTVRVTLSSPPGQPATDLPEFVLVARNDDARCPVRPRHPADGTTVLRLSGEELHRAGTIEREIAAGACRTPYALRGFLLGGRAASIRLEEPSPTTLVVR
ncbi:hypothetical protein [Streptomyces sp. 2323.1]|uniref:hypothetical protein n=1 Tax=Streptomyces sp. 2323.1 TaxID=1938841 RepID=UPI000BB79B74|nr:hypothetical protein [Streptomyces sp. 2323.1]